VLGARGPRPDIAHGQGNQDGGCDTSRQQKEQPGTAPTPPAGRVGTGPRSVSSGHGTPHSPDPRPRNPRRTPTRALARQPCAYRAFTSGQLCAPTVVDTPGERDRVAPYVPGIPPGRVSQWLPAWPRTAGRTREMELKGHGVEPGWPWRGGPCLACWATAPVLAGRRGRPDLPRTERPLRCPRVSVESCRIELPSGPGRLATRQDRSHDRDGRLDRVTLRKIGPSDISAQCRRSGASSVGDDDLRKPRREVILRDSGLQPLSLHQPLRAGGTRAGVAPGVLCPAPPHDPLIWRRTVGWFPRRSAASSCRRRCCWPTSPWCRRPSGPPWWRTPST
jgi:hypothetical protein